MRHQLPRRTALVILASAFVVVAIAVARERTATVFAGSQTPTPAPAASTGPVPLPNPNVPGFSYPVNEAAVLQHVNNNDQAWITTHAWGIWTALTMPASPGSSTRVYETWLSPIPGGTIAPSAVAGATAAPFHLLHRPRQFHGRRFTATAAGANPSTSDQVLVTVNWSPEMVKEVARQNLQSSSTLQTLIKNGTKFVTLTPRSLAIKPTYLWMGAPMLVQGRYFQFSTWPGPPNPAIPFPSNLWKQCVWVDTQTADAGTGTGAADTTCSADGSSRTPQTTYGLANFIGFKLTEQDVKSWQAQGNSSPAFKAGDPVILVAMHVTTREMTEWTWQTFWWQPDPAKPPAPSSAAIAAARPAQLTGAARHYAQCTAFQMVRPNQPIAGGTGTQPHLCFNPYLEAPFNHDQDLPGSKPWTYQGVTYNMNTGVQSNCMSCHAQAAYPQGATAPQYTADQYIDVNGPQFQKVLRMDFSWSIVQNVK